MNNENRDFIREKLNEEIVLPESLSKENIVSLVESVKVKKNRKGIVRRFVAVGVAACLMITGVSFLWDKGFFSFPEKPETEDFIENAEAQNTAESYDELLSFIKAYAGEYEKENNRGNYFYMYGTADDMVEESVNESMSGVKVESSVSADGFSGQKNQFGTLNLREENVYEDDILITDGEYFYCIDRYGKRLSIIKANADGTLERVYEGKEAHYDDRHLNKESIYYSGLYKYENYLIATYTKYIYENEKSYYAKQLSGVMIYDISDKASPVLKKEIALDGSYVSSRIVDKKLILISRYDIVRFYGTDDEESLIPSVYNGELKENIPCDCIMYTKNDNPEAYVNIAEIDLSDLEKEFSVTAFLGNAAETYCTRDTLYIIGYEYQYSRGGIVTDAVVSRVMMTTTDSKTTITKLDISGEKPEILCRTEFQGAILNSYSIDEYEGYLRVAVTKGFGDSSENFIYVFDSSLCKVGEITGLAKGEQIKSARFMGEAAYVVTFVQTDPLFVIDLSDPAKPEIAGEVKLPGFSSYLHPVGDGLLVGIGVGGTETGTDGSSKISLFDVTDPTVPKEIDSLSFPTSSLSAESKAFVSITEESFLIPYENWSYTAEYDESDAYYRYYSVVGALEVAVRDKKLVLENAYLACSVEGIARANFIGDFAYIFNNGEGTMASFDRKTGNMIDNIHGDNEKYSLIPNDVPVEEILH